MTFVFTTNRLVRVILWVRKILMSGIIHQIVWKLLSSPYNPISTPPFSPGTLAYKCIETIIKHVTSTRFAMYHQRTYYWRCCICLHRDFFAVFYDKWLLITLYLQDQQEPCLRIIFIKLCFFCSLNKKNCSLRNLFIPSAVLIYPFGLFVVKIFDTEYTKMLNVWLWAPLVVWWASSLT